MVSLQRNSPDQVQDATGFPLAGVTVTIRGPGNKLTQTDSEGQFDFQSLPEGEYELTATLPGFAPARQIARLIAGQRSVNFSDAHGPDPGADRRHGGEDGRD